MRSAYIVALAESTAAFCQCNLHIGMRNNKQTNKKKNFLMQFWILDILFSYISNDHCWCSCPKIKLNYNNHKYKISLDGRACIIICACIVYVSCVWYVWLPCWTSKCISEWFSLRWTFPLIHTTVYSCAQHSSSMADAKCGSNCFFFFFHVYVDAESDQNLCGDQQMTTPVAITNSCMHIIFYCHNL